MRRAMVVLGLVVATGGAHAGELQAPSIERGIEEPGKYSPANAFDGDPSTAFCAPHAHVRYDPSDADAAVLEQLTSVHVALPETGARKVVVDVYYPGSGRHENWQGVTVDHGDVDVAVTPPTGAYHKATTIEIDVEWATPAKAPKPAKPNTQPVCISEVTFVGAHGPLVLPDLRVAVDHTRARDLALADNHKVSAAYVAAYDWIYLNPEKMTSTWESALYTFHVDGTFTSTVYDLMEHGKPSITNGTWKVVGSTLRIGDWRVPLGACHGKPGYFCGADFFPTAAE